jgi:hypothetical protein
MGGVNDWGCLIPIGDLDDVVPTTFYGALNILITQLKADHPDSYIFMMTGFDYYDVEKDASSFGYYWTSTLDINDSTKAKQFAFNEDGHKLSSSTRYFGQTIRPVMP